MSKNLAVRIRKPSIAACKGPCGVLVEGAASGDAGETAGRVWPVWAEAGEVVLRGYLQRKNSTGNGTSTTVLWVKSGDFGRPKKVLDKGRWSLATTSRPQSPAVRGFPGLWYRHRFSRFSKFRWSVGQKIQRFQELAPCRSGTNTFPSESSNLASLYQRKEPGEIAARGVLNKLITRWFSPGYSPQDRVLCVAE